MYLSSSLLHGFQEAVGTVLFNLYRVRNFKNIADKHYPHVPMDHDEWPHTNKPDGGRENHVRFNFEEDHDSTTNKPFFDRWVVAVRTQGHTHVAGAEAYLKVIDENDLRERCEKRYKWEKRTYIKAMKGVAIPTKDRNVQAGAQASEGPDRAPEPNEGPTAEELATMTTAQRQGFQKKVSMNFCI
jgi:hypothetical protein